MPIIESLIGSKIYGFGSSTTIVTSFDSIATQVGTGSSATITFSSIPSTYQHLQIRGIARNATASGNYESTFFRFNGDTGNNYSGHYLIGSGSAAESYAWTSNAGIYGTFTTTSNALSNNMSVFIVDILDYANPNKNTTIRVLNGFDNNGTGASSYNQGIMGLSSGVWLNTTAVNSISINTNSNWTTSTSFALYGIKGV